MNKSLILACTLVLLALPFAYAHEPRGTYKNYCEPAAEWLVHEYGPPASGNLIQGYEDGNIGGDCDPGFSFDPGYVCAGFDPEDPVDTFLIGLCDASLNPPIADYDGHAEYSRGGAWLLVRSGDGTPVPADQGGAGTLFCFGDAQHHDNFATVWVDDLLLGAGVEVAIAADTVVLVPGPNGDPCGDFESDEVAEGTGTVTATFPAGLDGSYQVYVRGTQGHISTSPITAPSLCIPEAGAYNLADPTAEAGHTLTVNARPGCTMVDVNNGGPGTVRLTSSAGGSVTIPAGGSGTVGISWPGTFTIENLGPGPASGTYQQTP